MHVDISLSNTSSERPCCVVDCTVNHTQCGRNVYQIILCKRSPTQKNETNPIAQEPRVGGERQTDGYRTCSDLSQCYKSQLDRFTQYKWTHLQT